MDDENVSSSRRGMKKSKQATAQKPDYLPPEAANAIVAEVFPKLCRVKLDETESGMPFEFLCSYRRANLLGVTGSEYRERSPVAVGDRVKVTRSSPDSGVIEGLCERRSRLVRRAPGRDDQKVQHVLAANVDAVVIVASLKFPDFSPGLVDRFLIGALSSSITPILVVTKLDLLRAQDPKPWSIYSDLGFSVREVSVKSRVGLDDLDQELRGKTIVFCGKSGAGKTSLLSSLLGESAGRVGDVSDATGKGKHTTTSSILLGGPENSQWIDTPGVREFALTDIAPENLKDFFPEFKRSQCAVENCLHTGEVNCEGVSIPRYSSYLRIYESLKAGEG